MQEAGNCFAAAGRTQNGGDKGHFCRLDFLPLKLPRYDNTSFWLIFLYNFSGRITLPFNYSTTGDTLMPLKELYARTIIRMKEGYCNQLKMIELSKHRIGIGIGIGIGTGIGIGIKTYDVKFVFSIAFTHLH